MQLSRIFSLLLLFFVALACEDELLLPQLDEAEMPSELDLNFAITNDNSGTVTIQPLGRGVTAFTVDFGDGSVASTRLSPGSSINHVYGEGSYQVALEAMNINGETVTYTEALEVNFRAPENLAVTVNPTPGNPLSVDVSATADLETNFLAYFGEDDAADPISFAEGETVSYEYAAIGTYDVRVVAVSGATATTEETVTVTISNPILLPLDFEDGTKDFTFAGFGGVTMEVVDNPDPTGINTSARVGKINKAAGSETWAGAIIELGENVTFNGPQQLRLQVWSPTAGIPVLLKLENATNADLFAEVIVNTTVANQWEELIFDFTNADLSQEYSKVAVFFDFGTSGTGADYYFDGIEPATGGGGGGDDELALPLTFESADLEYEWLGFGGAGVEIVDNPDASGINTSARVAKLNKGNNSEVWAGSFIELPQPIDFSVSPMITLKTWSPAAGIPVILKVENGPNADINIEATVNTTVANAWEELTFDLSGGDLTQDYSKVVIFFDFGTAGTGADYYFDDILITGTDTGGGGGETVDVALPVTFETGDLEYPLIGFGGVTSEVIDNPDASGANTSARVAKMNKQTGSEVWAGASLELDAPIDFSGGSVFTVKVWSPAADIPVLFKLENGADGAIFIETTVNTTVAGAWEELTFDVSGGDLSRDYSKVVLFFDFGTQGTGVDYYFDDVTLGQ